MKLSDIGKYVTFEVTHHFTDSTQNVGTKFGLRECIDKDFARTPTTRSIWKSLDEKGPYYCLDNQDKIFIQGDSSTE